MNRLLFAVCFLSAVVARSAVRPGLEQVFDLRDGRIDWWGLHGRGFGAPLPQDQRALVIEQSTYPTLESIRRLTGVVMNSHNKEARTLAIDLLLKLEGWQETMESLMLGSKELWDHREDIAWQPAEVQEMWRRAGEHAHGWIKEPSGIVQGLQIEAISANGSELLRQCAIAGSTDAVLLGAPFLFDRTPKLSGRDLAMLPMFEAFGVNVMGAAKGDARDWAFVHSPDKTSEGRRLGWRRWWVAHARDFGAEPPSSEDASFEEVLGLCRTARRANPNARFEPVVWPSTAAGALASTSPHIAAVPPLASSSGPSDLGSTATPHGWRSWWPIALIPLIVVLFMLRRGSLWRR